MLSEAFKLVAVVEIRSINTLPARAFGFIPQCKRNGDGQESGQMLIWREDLKGMSIARWELLREMQRGAAADLADEPSAEQAGGSAAATIGPEAPEDDNLYPYYLGKDAGKQHGKLNRTLHSLNPFKV